MTGAMKILLISFFCWDKFSWDANGLHLLMDWFGLDCKRKQFGVV